MATDLYIISNIKTTKKEVLERKEFYLQKLKNLNLNPTHHLRIIDTNETWLTSEGDWEHEFPEIYCEKEDKTVPDTEAKELIRFNSPFVFNIRVYENCIELTTIYKYRFLYEDEKTDYMNEFRKHVFDIISIFGGTEIIYLADNACDKLSRYLELKVWEGVSYFDVKKDMIRKGLLFVSDYNNLKLNNLNYRNIKEIVFDEFKDLKA